MESIAEGSGRVMVSVENNVCACNVITARIPAVGNQLCLCLR